MKRILAAVLFAIVLNNFTVKAEEISAHKVIKVIDGDTVYIDFNDNGIAEAEERVRLNGIDTFETKLGVYLDAQMSKFNLTQQEALGMGYLAKEFAKKELLNKKVIAKYTAETQLDQNGRPLMSLYYNNGKNYEQEVLKAGLAVVYTKSNIAPDLEKYRNQKKLEANIKKAQQLNLVFYNNRSGKHHKIDCDFVPKMRKAELIKEPLFIHKSKCCFDVKPKKFKVCHHKPKADAKDGSIELYFLSPLKQNKPENKCKTNACKALVYNIDNAKESIDFAIYGIEGQDQVFSALVNAQNRGVKVRWVTDLTEKNTNIYFDTYSLMKAIPNYSTDYDSAESRNIPDYKYKLDFQGALMHNKFFIFDKKIVFTGSTNISSTCLTGYNSNVAVLIDSPSVANVFEQEFEQMYNGKFHNEKALVKANENINIENKSVSVYFSPANKTITTKAIPIIQQAKQYIYVPAFYLTHREITEELIKANKRGVEVKIIVDETSVAGKYVNVDYIKESGVSIKVENWNGKMHMKSMIIDDNILIVGSMNFTKQGENMNDENCLIIKDSPILTSAYKAHFMELWNSLDMAE